MAENKKTQEEFAIFSVRLERSILDRVDDLRATMRPIPNKLSMIRELLLFALEKKEGKK